MKNDDDEYDWYDYDMEHLAKAMLKAREAFNEYFDDQSLDGAYWDLKLTGWKLTAEFKPWEKIVMDPMDQYEQDPEDE